MICCVFLAGFVVIILIVVGLDLFAVIGISMSIVIVHATLRTPSNEDWSTGLYGGDSGAIPLNTGAAYLHSSATDTPIV